MIEAGIFDIGGVLAYPDSFDEVLAGVMERSQIPRSSFMPHWQKYYPLFSTGKLSEEDFWQTLSKEQQVNPIESIGLFEEEYKKQFHTFDAVFEIVTELKKTGLKIAILSNMIPPHTRYLRSINFVDGFDPVIFSCEVGLRKPDPRIYQLAIDQLQIKPEEAFFVDDKQRNINPANDEKLQAILFTGPEKLRAELHTFGCL